jgi:two-component system cell cycle response regulator DivK
VARLTGCPEDAVSGKESDDGQALHGGGAERRPRALLEARVNVENDRQPSVLVVEDEAPTRRVFANFLRRRGFEVLEAEHGEGALLVAKQTEPDVIVLDIQMPVLDGLTTAELLKLDATTAHIPLIAVTGHPFEGGADEARRHGFAAYLPKPLALDELVDAISHVLAAD